MSTTKRETRKTEKPTGRDAGKGSKRHSNMKEKRHALNHNVMKRINKSAISKLKAKGLLDGLEEGEMPSMVGCEILDEVKGVLSEYLHKVLRDATTYVEHEKRTTVCFKDINRALQGHGINLYGDDFKRLPHGFVPLNENPKTVISKEEHEDGEEEEGEEYQAEEEEEEDEDEQIEEEEQVEEAADDEEQPEQE